MIEACGVCGQKEEASKLFQDIKKYLEPSIDTINAYFQECGKTEKRKNKKTETTTEEEKINIEKQKKEKAMSEKLMRIIATSLIEFTYSPIIRSASS